MLFRSGLFTFKLNTADQHVATSFTFQVQDDGGVASGGVDLDQTPNTLTINVNAVNDPPVGTSFSRTTNDS